MFLLLEYGLQLTLKVLLFTFLHLIFYVFFVSRVNWVTWVTSLCRAPSTSGSTIGKAQLAWRTWLALNPCKGICFFMKELCFSARRERRVERDMIGQPLTASNTAWWWERARDQPIWHLNIYFVRMHDYFWMTINVERWFWQPDGAVTTSTMQLTSQLWPAFYI